MAKSTMKILKPGKMGKFQLMSGTCKDCKCEFEVSAHECEDYDETLFRQISCPTCGNIVSVNGTGRYIDC